MSATVVLDLIDALVAQAPAQMPAGVQVYDFNSVSEDPGDFLMIGVEDPDTEDADFSAESTQEWATALGNMDRDERGEVTCAALSWNGNGNAVTARAAVKAILAGLATLLHTTPALGVEGALWTGFGSRMTVNQIASEDGVRVLVVFRIAFVARV